MGLLYYVDFETHDKEFFKATGLYGYNPSCNGLTRHNTPLSRQGNR